MQKVHAILLKKIRTAWTRCQEAGKRWRKPLAGWQGRVAAWRTWFAAHREKIAYGVICAALGAMIFWALTSGTELLKNGKTADQPPAVEVTAPPQASSASPPPVAESTTSPQASPPSQPVDQSAPKTPAGEAAPGAGQSPPSQSLAQLRPPIAYPVTSAYGWRVHPVYGDWRYHTGVDMDAPVGTPVKAALAGRTVRVEEDGSLGLVIILDHGNGIETVYGHLQTATVKSGQWVEQGQTIGKVGKTGVVKEPHLHFEIRKNGDSLDPAPYF